MNKEGHKSISQAIAKELDLDGVILITISDDKTVEVSSASKQGVNNSLLAYLCSRVMSALFTDPSVPRPKKEDMH